MLYVRLVALLVAILVTLSLLMGTDPRTGSLLVNTLLLSGGTCAMGLPVGTALALLFVKTNLKGRGIFAVIFLIMLLVPLYLQCAGWQAGFGLQGWYTLAFQQGTWLSGWRGAVWVHALAAIPWVMLIVGVALYYVEPEFEEQALLDGTPGQVFRHVTLPRMAAPMVVAALWVFVTTAGEMTVTDLFQIRTYAEEVYTQLNLGGWVDAPWADLWNGALLTALLVIVAAAICGRLAKHFRAHSVHSTWRYSIGGAGTPAGAGMPAAVLATAFTAVVVVGVPLTNLGYQAGVLVTESESGRIREWSFQKVLMLIASAPRDHASEWGWSWLIGMSAASTATVLAIPVAWMARRGGAYTLPAISLTAIGLAVPGPMIGLGIIWLLNWPDVPMLVFLYDRTILAPWLAQTIRALPLTILMVWHAFASIPIESTQSAKVEGAGWVTQLVRIAIPARYTTLAAAWLVGLVVAIGELAATVLVIPPGMTPLSVRIFGLLHYGVEDQVAGICLAEVALVTILSLVVILAGRWWDHPPRPMRR